MELRKKILNTIKCACSIVELNGLAEAISAISWADGTFHYDFCPLTKENYRNLNKLLELFFARVFVIYICKTM